MPVTGSRGLWKTTREASGGQKCGQKMRSRFKKTRLAHPLGGRPGRALSLVDLETLAQGWSTEAAPGPSLTTWWRCCLSLHLSGGGGFTGEDGRPFEGSCPTCLLLGPATALRGPFPAYMQREPRDWQAFTAARNDSGRLLSSLGLSVLICEMGRVTQPCRHVGVR